MKSFTTHIVSKLFGEVSQSCLLCADSCKGNICLCEACLAELPFTENACATCALPLSSKNSQCGQCLSHPSEFSRCISLVNYASPIDHLIHNMKYHNQLAVADLLGKLLANKIAELKISLPEQIIPVPLHISRLQKRGYNQAVEIARPLSKKFNIPINLTDCSRVKATHPQFDLSISERAGNMQDAFEVLRTIHVKHVAIVDDIMTTGSTVTEFARLLKKAGVETVDLWICARAIVD